MKKKPYAYIIQWEVKQMKAFGVSTPFLGVEEMVEWSKGLPAKRWCCPWIESTKCSFYLLDYKTWMPVGKQYTYEYIHTVCIYVCINNMYVVSVSESYT